MKTNGKRIFWGILLTLIVFLASTFAGKSFSLNNEFIPDTFITNIVMLTLSICLIWGFKKYVSYKISLPKFKKTLRPILFGLLAAIIVNIIMSIVERAFGFREIESHSAHSALSPLQFFIFIFICTPIAEEVLFRGFLQNILKPLKVKGIRLFKRHISVPVLISAVVFGLVHLIVITSGSGSIFVIRTVLFATTIGLIAGYYQEKYDNNAYAITVHMAANFVALTAVFIASLTNLGV
jgi:membrane protease YdiL (CAAX protease family)